MAPSDTLLIGFGNPGRGDDGLGPALADRIESLALPNVGVEVDYQLAPEHAAAAARSTRVIFADASMSGTGPFTFQRIEPRQVLSFSTHGLQPRDVIALAETLAGRPVIGYLLAIRGYSFEPFTESLTTRAQRNLGRATTFTLRFLRDPTASHAVLPAGHRLSTNEHCEGGR